MADADAAYQAKRYADAVPLYQSAVTSTLPNPDRARALSRLGYCFYHLGDKPQAQASWASISDKFPNEALYVCDGLLRAANLSAAAAATDEAITRYAQASTANYLTADETSALAYEALFRVGNLYVRRAELAKANAAKAARAAGKVPLASQVWDTAADDFGLARQAYETLVQDSPASAFAVDGYVALVALDYEYAMYDRGRNFEDVVAAANGFGERFPVATAIPAVLRLVRAEALHNLGKHGAALADLDVILKMSPKDAGQAYGSAQFLQARCHERMGQFDQAIAGFRKFLTDGEDSFLPEDDSATARRSIGCMLQLQGDPAGAEAAFQEVVQLYPETIWADDARAAIDGIRKERGAR
jgi:tetratricopeptide (TPR) repeat protein